jgi:hypothetical protein
VEAAQATQVLVLVLQIGVPPEQSELVRQATQVSVAGLHTGVGWAQLESMRQPTQVPVLLLHVSPWPQLVWVAEQPETQVPFWHTCPAPQSLSVLHWGHPLVPARHAAEQVPLAWHTPLRHWLPVVHCTQVCVVEEQCGVAGSDEHWASLVQVWSSAGDRLQAVRQSRIARARRSGVDMRRSLAGRVCGAQPHGYSSSTGA